MLASLSLLWTQTALASGFLAPLSVVSGEGSVELADHTTLEGKISSTAQGGQIKKLKVVVEGVKHKLKADEIVSVQVNPSTSSQVLAAMDGSGSVLQAKKTVSGTLQQDTVRFERRILPNGKPAVLQLINPGFAGGLEVYPDPKAKETGTMGVGGVAVVGNAAKSYYVSQVGGEEVTKVTKAKYNRQSTEIFASCGTFSPPSTRFLDFAQHVQAYDLACVGDAPTAPAPESTGSESTEPDSAEARAAAEPAAGTEPTEE